MDDFVSQATVDDTCRLLDSPALIKEMVDINYELALRHFSYAVLEKRLWYLVRSFYGMEAADAGCVS